MTVIQSVYDNTGLKYYNVGSQGASSLDSWLATFISNTNAACYGVASSTIVVYVKTPHSNPPPQLHMFDSVGIGSGSYSTIQNLEICNVKAGVSIGGTSNIVSGCFIHDTTGSGIYAGASVGAEIVSNTIQGLGYTMIYLVGGGNNWVHHNTLRTNSTVILGNVHLTAGRDTCGVGFTGGTNNLVECNTISYMNQSFFDYWYEANTEVRYNYCFHASGAGSPDGTGLLFHHNILDLDDAGSGISAGHSYSASASPPSELPWDTGPVLVYNNLVYNFHSYGLYTTGTSATNVVFRNNIFVTHTSFSGTSLAICAPGTDSDYNLFYSTGVTPRWTFPSIYYSLSSLYAAAGEEGHSVYADPQFVSTNPVTAADFQLKSTSPCINVGQDLKRVGLLPPAQEYKDYLGTLIPQAAGPDIGAYEKIHSLGPPTNLHIDR